MGKIFWATISVERYQKILGCPIFLLYINDLPDNFICNIDIYADGTTLYSKFNQASDLWQQLELASELESDIRDIVNDAVNDLLISMLEKLLLVLFEQPNNTGAIDVKMDGSARKEKSSFNMLALTFSFKFD